MHCDVLVVDDNRDLSAVYKRFLSQHEYSVECFSSGRLAIEFMLRQQVGVVVLEFMMPELDGIEVLRRIRETPIIAKVPVVMNSAVMDKQVSEFAISRGAN